MIKKSFANRRFPCSFIKWVGGKYQLLDRIVPALPMVVSGTYYEPFLGGGALFFELVRRGRIVKAVLSDTNRELINTYRVVKNKPDQLIQSLFQYKKLPNGGNHKETYYEIRDQDIGKISQVERASRFIYLNLTGYNGLYRENKDGKFNVPFGCRAGDSDICSEYRALRIRSASKALSIADLRVSDYEAACRGAKGEIGNRDLIYFDPPYDPVSETSNFSTYSKKPFEKKEQRNLARLFLSLADQGVQVFLSNSDTPLTRRLYQGKEIITLQARRSVNSKGGLRAPVNEIFVKGTSA